MSHLTIVVPRIGSSCEFESTLASVLRYRMSHHQVIVSQGKDQIDEYDLGDEVRFVDCDRPASVGAILNAVLPFATGDVINFLRPGLEVHHHWFVGGLRRLQNPLTGTVAVPLVTGPQRSQVVSRGLAANRRMIPRHVTGSGNRRITAPASWAGFYRTNLLRQLVPLDEILGDEFVTLDIGLSLASLGFSNAFAEDSALALPNGSWHSCRPSAAHGRDAQRMLNRHGDSRHRELVQRLFAGFELAASAVQPGRLFQMLGRSAAREMESADREFRQRLGELASSAGMHGTTATGPDCRRAA